MMTHPDAAANPLLKTPISSRDKLSVVLCLEPSKDQVMETAMFQSHKIFLPMTTVEYPIAEQTEEWQALSRGSGPKLHDVPRQKSC